MKLYKGRAKKEDTKQLMEMLDDVFFRDDEENRDFLSLLPKLYKEKYNPSYNNYIISEDGEIKAAVGLYPAQAFAAGRELRVGGIGNVAVTRDSRRKGYMSECLNDCIDIMKADGTVYSVLGGDRQRYGYFGFEPAGISACFSVNKRSLKHVLGKEIENHLTAKELTEADVDLLEKIKALYETEPFHFIRPSDDILDILKSWKGKPYAAFDGDKFAGYFVLDCGAGIMEARTAPETELLDLIICAMSVSGKDKAEISFPLYDTEYCEAMSKIYNSSSLRHSEMINILDYATFIEAFLAVKAQRTKLANGSLVMLIHGMNGDERLEVTVNGENVSVSKTEKPADVELEHREAIRFIASMYSEKRNRLPEFAASWFPVDFFAYSLDNV